MVGAAYQELVGELDAWAITIVGTNSGIVSASVETQGGLL
jgi:hypothetical protein